METQAAIYMRQAGYTIEVHYNYAKKILDDNNCYTPERAIALVVEMNKEYATNMFVDQFNDLQQNLTHVLSRITDLANSKT